MRGGLPAAQTGNSLKKSGGRYAVHQGLRPEISELLMDVSLLLEASQSERSFGLKLDLRVV